MGTFTTKELKDINDLRDKWLELEHDKWKLLSFSEYDARFGWVVGGMYTKYVHVARATIDFLASCESSYRSAT
jgi:hypothetical protein